MKIILINNAYATGTHGGAERITERIAAGLERAGHEVFIIAAEPKKNFPAGGYFHQEKNIYFLPSDFFYLDKYPLWRRFFYHIFDSFNFIQAARIKKILRKEKPNLVITNNLKGLGLLSPAVIKNLKIKHIHILHDVQLLHPSGLMFWGKEKIIDSFLAGIYQAINKCLFGSPAAIISPSRWLLNLHIARGFFKKAEKKVLPNYFASFDSRIKEPTGETGVFRFIYVGQLEEHKGVRFLIETFREFLKDDFSAELLVVGSGSQEQEIKEISRECREIKILGKKNSAEVAELMLNADCLIVPSFCYENSPTVIYEAAASGLPVIASHLGGIPELIETVGGLTFTPGESAELLGKMRLLFTRPAESDKIKKKEAAYHRVDYIKEILSL
jgi:glycosyltransferase involved in cell wall biosynthesis